MALAPALFIIQILPFLHGDLPWEVGWPTGRHSSWGRGEALREGDREEENRGEGPGRNQSS